MDDAALPHSIENDEIAINDGDGVAQKDFLVCLIKACIFHVVSAILCTFYTIHRRNDTFLSTALSGIVQLWSGILIFSVALPVVSPIRGQPWLQCAFWIFIILLPPLSVVIVPVIYESRTYDKCCHDIADYFLNSTISGIAACIVLMVTCALRAIRLRLKAFHHHNYEKLCWVAMQCIDSTLRTGILQIAVLTTALVAFGKRTENEILDSAQRIDNLNAFHEYAPSIKSDNKEWHYSETGEESDGDYWLQHQEFQRNWLRSHNYNSTNDDYYSYYRAYRDARKEWYETTFKDKDEQDTMDSLHGLQAGFAGLAINIFLIQAIMARHVLKLGLIDVLKGRMTWMECLAALLQLIMVVTVAVLVTFGPIDFIFAYTRPDWEDRDEILQKRLVLWQLFGLVVPIVLSLLLHVFFARALQDDASPTGQIFRARHRRVTKVEYQIQKGEEQHAALKDSLERGLEGHKQALEGHKQQTDNSLTDLESKISSLGNEMQQQASQVDDAQQQANQMEQSLQGRLDDSLRNLEHRISSLGDELQQQANQMEQSIHGQLGSSLMDIEFRISSLGDEMQEAANQKEQSLAGRNFRKRRRI